MNEKNDNKVRLDKRLWAACFSKTRALTKAVIEDDKVHYRSKQYKLNKEPRVGEELTIHTGFDKQTVMTCALSVVRHDAPETQTLYEEVVDSVESRERVATMHEAGALSVQTEGWPNKKQRWQIHQLHGGQD